MVRYVGSLRRFVTQVRYVGSQHRFVTRVRYAGSLRRFILAGFPGRSVVSAWTDQIPPQFECGFATAHDQHEKRRNVCPRQKAVGGRRAQVVVGFVERADGDTQEAPEIARGEAAVSFGYVVGGSAHSPTQLIA